MNYNIRKVLNAILLLQDVAGMELEVTALSHKIKAMYMQSKENLEGVALIDAMDDEELAAAIRLHDKQIGMGQHLDPISYQYLRRNRAKALALAES